MKDLITEIVQALVDKPEEFSVNEIGAGDTKVLDGRLLGSFLGVNVKITGSIRLHCSFVSSILILLHNQDLMSRFF